MRCAHCKAVIEGRYIQAGRLCFHPGHFLCHACQLPIQGSYQVHAGRFLHPACYAEHHAPRCPVCAQAITGQAVIHEGRAHHPRCYEQTAALQCVVCAKGIVGPALTDYWGNTYHAAHAREFGTCQYCARLTHASIGGGGLNYPDGRVICRGCHRTAVHREADVRRLLTEVRARFGQWGVDLGRVDIPLKVVDRNQLNQLLRRSAHQPSKWVSGLWQMVFEQQGATRQNKQGTMYLLGGMPLAVIEATAAHELMHAWNYYHARPHAFALEEGACNYMSYRMYLARNNEEGRYHIDALMKDPDPAYGAGFRKVKGYVDRHGFPRLLTLLKESHDFPMFGGWFG
jgi:hypothetical protein